MITTIDGISMDILGNIERNARIESSEISGMMMNMEYFNDVYGTWFDYDITLAVPYNQQDAYEELYGILTQPVPAHTFVLPYGQDVITIVGRVENVKDVPYKVKRGIYWAGINFQVKANHPTRTVQLGEVVTIGLPDLPFESQATIGDLYEYTATGWVQRFYANAEDEYF